jgi:hypothetical protein
LGGAKVLDLEDQDRVVAVVVSRNKPNLAEEGTLLEYFFCGGGTLFLLGVLAKTGWWNVVFWW